ncbi:flagellar basal body L-ring protein FlgH [Salinisphaera sp. RV14]|uniref:flagellar basal body L-ring protein FlgH n=1 Tax=unclassified Salinisphaera TaxID=2649847 RepID=UPI003F85B31D
MPSAFVRAVLTLAALAALAGCATNPPAQHAYLKPQAMPVKPQSSPKATGGLVFSSRSHVSLFQDHRFWRSGDLVTVNIAQNATASANDNAQLQRQSSVNDSVSAFLGVPLTVGSLNGSPFKPSFNTSSNNQFKGKGQTSASNQVQGQVTAVVTQVEPNGVLSLRGRTDVNIDGEVRTIQITGYARQQDIGPNNTVSSNNLANMNVQYVGTGAMQTAQRVPWMENVLNKIWPF